MIDGAEPELVDRSVETLYELMRIHGTAPQIIVGNSYMQERAWLTLIKQPTDSTVERLIREIRDGNVKSRRFLLYYFYNTDWTDESYFSKASYYQDRRAQVRKKLGEQSQRIVPAVCSAASNDLDWAVEFLFQLAHHSEVDIHQFPQARPILEAGLQAEPLVCSMAAWVLSRSEDLDAKTKETIVDRLGSVVAGEKAVAFEFASMYDPNVVPAKFVALQAIVNLDVSAAKLAPKMVEMLNSANNDVSRWAGRLPGITFDQNKIPRLGGFFPLILQALGNFGEEARIALPYLLEHHQRLARPSDYGGGGGYGGGHMLGGMSGGMGGGMMMGGGKPKYSKTDLLKMIKSAMLKIDPALEGMSYNIPFARDNSKRIAFDLFGDHWWAAPNRSTEVLRLANVEIDPDQMQNQGEFARYTLLLSFVKGDSNQHFDCTYFPKSV